MQRWGFIYTLGGPSTEVRRDAIGSAECELLCRGVPSVDDAPAVAKELLDEGVQLIELCGAFAGPGLAAVLAAVGDRVPVGAVFYGGEAGTGLHRLFG